MAPRSVSRQALIGHGARGPTGRVNIRTHRRGGRAPAEMPLHNERTDHETVEVKPKGGPDQRPAANMQ
jgi:hypothetical protein